MKGYSKTLEKEYYSRNWPVVALPYLHLEPYLRCWMDPVVFKGKTILTIGAGECIYSRLISERFAPKKVIASELFRERMLPAVRENSSPALSFVAADCYRLPLRSASCDVVWGSLILHHLPERPGVVSEIYRVLKPQGLYLGFEPNLFNPVILYRFLFGPHSPNQHSLMPGHLDVFRQHGFNLRTTFFYAKFPALRSRILTTCFGIQAWKV